MADPPTIWIYALKANAKPVGFAPWPKEKKKEKKKKEKKKPA